MPLRPKCLICKTAYRKRQQALQCSICSGFVHRRSRCSNLSVTDIHKHSSLNIPYYCKSCKDACLPLSEEENDSPLFNASSSSLRFDCDASLDPDHLNTLFSTSDEDNDHDLDKHFRSLNSDFQPLADKYYNAEKIPFDDFEITAQNQISEKFSLEAATILWEMSNG